MTDTRRAVTAIEAALAIVGRLRGFTRPGRSRRLLETLAEVLRDVLVILRE